MFAKLGRLPFNCTSRRGFMEWADWGGPNLLDMEVMNMAALLRMARRTLTPGSWQAHCVRLDRAADGLGLAQWHAGARAPDYWDTPALCELYAWADRGFPADRVPWRVQFSKRRATQAAAIGAQMMAAVPRPGRKPSQAMWSRAGRQGLRSSSLVATFEQRAQDFGLAQQAIDWEEVRSQVVMLAPGWRLNSSEA